VKQRYILRKHFNFITFNLIKSNIVLLFIINLLVIYYKFADSFYCGNIDRMGENRKCREISSRTARANQICR